MNPRTRQDELVRLLRRRGSTTVSYLTESLDVSRRTVLRDIASLREQGFVIHTSSGPGGGVSLDPTSVLISPRLTSSEVFALLITYAVLKQTHSVPFASLADSGLAKIERALSRDRVRELRRIMESVYIRQSRPDIPTPTVQDIDLPVLSVFETCFLRSRRMQFDYTDRTGHTSVRQADPHAMLVLSPAWYIVGYDTGKAAFRHFRMDRIHASSALQETFRRRAFTLEEGVCPFTAMTFN